MMLFKIFPLRKTLHLFLIILTLSIAMTISAHIALGAFDTIALSISEPNSITVFSSNARLPQTGVIPIKIVDEIKGQKGVEIVSPEVLGLVKTGNRILFLRGITSEALTYLYKPRLVEGELILANQYALLGIRAAKLIGVKSDDTIVVNGLVANVSRTMMVEGIFETGGALDDEIVTNISTGQFFRGFSKEFVSTIIVKGILPDVRASIMGQIGVNDTTDSVKNMFTDWARLMPASTIASAPETKSVTLGIEDILSRSISFSQSIIWTLMSIVLGASSVALYYSVSWTLIDSLPTIMILRAVGFSKTKVAAMLLLETMIVSLVAGVLGYTVGYTSILSASESNALRIFFHTIVPSFRIDVFLALAILPVALILMFLLINFRSASKTILT